jgi:hypothetical protein
MLNPDQALANFRALLSHPSGLVTSGQAMRVVVLYPAECRTRRRRRTSGRTETTSRRQSRHIRFRCDALLRAPLTVQFQAECPQGARKQKPKVRKPTVGRSKNGHILCDCGGNHYKSLCPVKGGHWLCGHAHRADQCNIPPCNSGYKWKPNAERNKCKKCGRVKAKCNLYAASTTRNCEAYCLRHGKEQGQ